MVLLEQGFMILLWIIEEVLFSTRIDADDKTGIPNTAGAWVDDLMKHGVLIELTGQQRNRMFVFYDYHVLFSKND